MTTTNQSPAALRAEADRLENEAHKPNRGKIFVRDDGIIGIHAGNKGDRFFTDGREATEAEVAALCIIPEFKAYLEKVREG